jgi:hypothetical protein
LYEGAFKPESNQKANVRTSSLKELFKDKGFVLSYKKLPKKNNSSSEFSRSTFEENNGFTIVDETVKVAETDSVTTYTLLIERDDNTEGNLENLVLYSELQDGELGYVIEYHSLSDLGLTEEEIIENGIKDVDGILTDDNTAGKVVFYHNWVAHCIRPSTSPCFCGGVPGTYFLEGQCGHWESGYIFVDEDGGGFGGSGGGGTGDTGGGYLGSGGGTGTGSGIPTSPVTLTSKQLLVKKFKKQLTNITNGTPNQTTCFNSLSPENQIIIDNYIGSFALLGFDESNPLSTLQIQQQAFEFAEEAMAELCGSSGPICVILPSVLNPSEIVADYNPNLFGDYPAPSVQQDHNAIQQQFNNLRNTSGNLAAVNYLINTYNMNTFGSNTITTSYPIVFANGLSNGAQANAIIGYNSSGDMVTCHIEIDIDLFTFTDFGHITRVIKHELYHILQPENYGQFGISNPAREFDAYYSQIFGFRDLKQIQDGDIVEQLAKIMISYMKQLSDSETQEGEKKIKLVKQTFPELCKN